MNQSLTVIIPTLNEEADLKNCIESVKGIADKIIVVDSGSTDDTLEIAKKYQAQIVFHKFINFSDQRNYADSLVKNGWILSIEADVIIPEDLTKEIKEAIKNDEFYSYYIERINLIWGKPIMHTNWGPKDDCHIWLYKKGSGKWESDVHEEFVTSLPTSRLKNRLLHHNYDSISEFIGKMDKYSTIASNKKQNTSIIYPLVEFIKRYFYKLGFLDGYHGLFLSYLQSIYFLSLFTKNKTNSP